MPVSTASILADADAFRRAYPSWPHAAPVTTTDPASQGGTTMPHDHSWAEDMDEVRACCPDYNPLLAGTGIRCPGDPAARHEAGTTTDPKGAPMSGPCDDDDCCDDCCEGED